VADDDDEKEEQPSKKKKIIKLAVIGLLALVVLGGGGWFAYWKFIAPEGTPMIPFMGSDTGEGAADGEEMMEEEGPGEIVTLPTFLVNLADPLGRRYLKLTVEVEVLDEDVVEEVNMSEAKVRDAIILLLSSKSYTDLASLESKILLKNEIVERLNQVLGGRKVKRVYFTEMVIQ
jgi:flagellar protein FliL